MPAHPDPRQPLDPSHRPGPSRAPDPADHPDPRRPDPGHHPDPRQLPYSSQRPNPPRHTPNPSHRPDPRRPPDPYHRLRDPEVRRRYRSCLISLLLTSGAVPFLAISYLVIRTLGYQARLAPLSGWDRVIGIAAQVVFFWSTVALVWGAVYAWRYLRARRRAPDSSAGAPEGKLDRRR